MKVSLIRINNILGIDELEIEPGSLTEISGRNASGKTSVLEAIKSVLKGGNDATLLREGEAEGSVVIILDDGTEIGRKFTKGKSQPTAGRDGMRASKPQSFIDDLSDSFSVNPVEFLNSSGKRRVEILLSSMPIEADAKRASQIFGAKVATQGRHALEILDMLRGELFNRRTGVSRAVKEKRASVKQLQASLPETQISTEAARESINAINLRLDKRADEFTTAIGKIDDECEKAIAQTKDKISKLKATIEGLRDKARGFKAKADNDIAEAREVFREDTHADTVEVQLVTDELDRIARDDNTRDIATGMSAEGDTLQVEADDLTGRITLIDQYKTELLAELPIKGLELRDGALYLDGVAFDHVNTAQQVRVAVELAKLRAGKLGLICVDGLELLDSKHYKAFVDQAKDSDVQLIITRVSDGALKVKAA